MQKQPRRENALSFAIRIFVLLCFQPLNSSSNRHAHLRLELGHPDPHKATRSSGQSAAMLSHSMKTNWRRGNVSFARDTEQERRKVEREPGLAMAPASATLVRASVGGCGVDGLFDRDLGESLNVAHFLSLAEFLAGFLCHVFAPFEIGCR
jgi:hypothetical protein